MECKFGARCRDPANCRFEHKSSERVVPPYFRQRSPVSSTLLSCTSRVASIFQSNSDDDVRFRPPPRAASSVRNQPSRMECKFGARCRDPANCRFEHKSSERVVPPYFRQRSPVSSTLLSCTSRVASIFQSNSDDDVRFRPPPRAASSVRNQPSRMECKFGARCRDPANCRFEHKPSERVVTSYSGLRIQVS